MGITMVVVTAYVYDHYRSKGVAKRIRVDIG
jgi:hypothetical protein